MCHALKGIHVYTFMHSMSFKKDLPLILDMIRLSKPYRYSSVMSVCSSAGGYLGSRPYERVRRNYGAFTLQ